jgi:hypothetical protein
MDNPFTNPSPVRRNSLHIYDRESISKTLSDAELTQANALSLWVDACSSRAIAHALRAADLRSEHLLLMTFSIVCSSLAAVLSGMAVEGVLTGTDKLWGSVVGLVVSSGSAVALGLHGLLDPAGRRKSHLLAETQFKILARDVAVYLSSVDNKEDTSDRLTLYSALREYQRRLDNLDSVAPVI